MSGWKLWESADSQVIMDGADGDAFEIIKWKVEEFAIMQNSTTFTAVIAAVLYVF